MLKQTSNLINHFKIQQTTNGYKIIEEFNKPIMLNIFNNNLYILRENSKFIEFNNNSWNKRPEKYCLDYYEDPDYWPIILLVNNIGSRFNFVLEKMPYKNYIISPNNDIIQSLLTKVVDY